MVQCTNRSRILIIPLLLWMILHPGDARADVGVPPAQPGSSLSPGDFETNVQMVSEKVEITIFEEPQEALITASFQMRNTGTSDEEFNVWFPYGEKFPDSKGVKIIQAMDFRAWVDGEEVEITIAKSDEWNLIWVHWNVYFQAQEPVDIRVSYRVLPNRQLPPHYNFSYILETGAGWQGVIEKAEIRVNLPYSLQSLDDLLGLGEVLFAEPSGYTINPDGIQWTFEDLEPSEDDNIKIKPLKPGTWFNIHDSLVELETNPDNWEAHRDLASGLSGWIWFREWAEGDGLVDPSSEMESIIKMIGYSHLKVLELSPLNERHSVSAILFFEEFPDLIGGEQLEAMFEDAMKQFPDNQQLVWVYEDALEDGVFEVKKALDEPTPTAAAITATTEAAEEEGGNRELGPPSLPLIMGILFIGGGIVLLIVAIRRRAK